MDKTNIETVFDSLFTVQNVHLDWIKSNLKHTPNIIISGVCLFLFFVFMSLQSSFSHSLWLAKNKHIKNLNTKIWLDLNPRMTPIFLKLWSQSLILIISMQLLSSWIQALQYMTVIVSSHGLLAYKALSLSLVVLMTSEDRLEIMTASTNFSTLLRTKSHLRTHRG